MNLNVNRQKFDALTAGNSTTLNGAAGNSTTLNGAAVGQADGRTVKLSNGQTVKPQGDFTITKVAVSPEELEAALLPASTLLRDDSLGKLFAQAFNLPPPPIPDFAAT